MELVKVYHGTANELIPLILKEGIRSIRNEDHVYVTTDPKRAAGYASCWIYGSVYNMELNGHLFAEYGAILELELPLASLEIDNYDLVNEPNQYRLNGHIPPAAIRSISLIEQCEHDVLERIVHVNRDLFAKIEEYWGKPYELQGRKDDGSQSFADAGVA